MAIIATASVPVNGRLRPAPYVSITFTFAELQHGAHCGALRNIENLLKGNTDRYYTDEDKKWQFDIESALAEIAACRATGRYWVGMGGNPKAPDATIFDVRHTAYHNGHLCIYKSDKADWPYILVTGHAPTMRVHGYLPAGEAWLHPEWWEQKHGEPMPGSSVYWVPQSALHPLADLVCTCAPAIFA